MMSVISRFKVISKILFRKECVYFQLYQIFNKRFVFLNDSWKIIMIKGYFKNRCKPLVTVWCILIITKDDTYIDTEFCIEVSFSFSR